MRARPLVLVAALLAGCSSKEKVPVLPGERFLTDRIEALENDVAQLHAEMQELRVKYLPIAEMSEDEFNRHVELQIGDVPAEQREALEKQLRDKRKAATLDGKALAEFWDERFYAEPEDPAWAKAAEELCLPRLTSAVGEKGKVAGFSCRRDRCRAEVELATDGPQVDQAVGACTREPSDADTFADAAVTRKVVGSNGRVRMTVFVSRKGQSMKLD